MWTEYELLLKFTFLNGGHIFLGVFLLNNKKNNGFSSHLTSSPQHFIFIDYRLNGLAKTVLIPSHDLSLARRKTHSERESLSGWWARAWKFLSRFHIFCCWNGLKFATDSIRNSFKFPAKVHNTPELT